MNLTPWKTTTSSLWPTRGSTDLTSFQREMNDLFNSFFNRSLLGSPRTYQEDYYPVVDVQEKEDRYLVEAELPGLEEKDVEVDLHNNILTLKGEKRGDTKQKDTDKVIFERYYGAFCREIPFEEEIAPDKVKAELKKGILQVELMKKEKSKVAHKKIEIIA